MHKPKATTSFSSVTATPVFDSTDMSAITSNPSKTSYKMSTTTKLIDSGASLAATKSTTTNFASTKEGKIYSWFVLSTYLRF